MAWEWLDRVWLGNSMKDWLTSILIIIGALIAAKVVYWVFSRIVKTYTKRSKNRVDDLLVDMIEEPAMVIITLIGIWYALGRLALSEEVGFWLGQVFEVLIILTVGWTLVRVFDSFYKEYLVKLAEKSDSDMDDQLMPIIRTGVKTLIWAIAIVVALDNAGQDVGALLAGLGIGGLALAMAAKDTVANVFGGVTIFTDKPFRLNDRVQVAGIDGMVEEVGVRSTRIRTLEGRIVTVPNSKFTDSPVENISLEPSRKNVVKLGLTYDTTPDQMEKALEILKNIALKNDGVEDNVLTGFTEFGDFSMNLLFIYYIKKSSDILQTQTAVNMEILRRFTENNLDFAFPTQVLYNKNL